jgi:predicted porin
VGYNTPVMSGFQAGFQSLTADYDNGGAYTGVAYNLTYNNGPLKLAVATTNKNGSAGAGGGWVNTVYGGTYNMGAFTFIAALNKTSFAGTYAGLNNMTINSLGWNYVVSPAVDMNVAYGTLADDANSANKATQMGITARYKLSARTSLYAGMGNVKNEGYSMVSALYGAGAVTAAEQNSTLSSYMLGIKHTF